jgi:hypothetical protein
VHQDDAAAWRIICFIEADAILILDVIWLRGLRLQMSHVAISRTGSEPSGAAPPGNRVLVLHQQVERPERNSP